MKEEYNWNHYSEQPDISIPRKNRIWHHLKHAGSYFSLTAANLWKAAAVIPLYRRYRRTMYQTSSAAGDPFAVTVSPSPGKNKEVIRLLNETGVTKTLVRVHSWEPEALAERLGFCRMLKREGMDITVALLQDRNDVLDQGKWRTFVDTVFSQFKEYASFFEIGHAWNRIKWGLWHYKEYLKLAQAAVEEADKYEVKLVGPAVIDFEFHLYAPVLKRIPFDAVTSLLYVDRVGAPENKQSGWSTSRKLALLKAIVDRCSRKPAPLWITEFNWPVQGTGKFSPVGENLTVSEEEQASFLVRYYILCLASGFVDRITYWQLIAPGYGLIDDREEPWRKRPGFYAYQTMVSQLKGAEFIKKIPHPKAEVFIFQREKNRMAAVWSREEQSTVEFALPGKAEKIVERDGAELPANGDRIIIDGHPRYIVFK